MRCQSRPFLNLGLGLVLAMARLVGGSSAWAADVTTVTLEPAHGSQAVPRTPQPDHWRWGHPDARITPTGDLEWAPKPFVFAHGAVVKYIDFAAGSDGGDGSRQHPWKHHPWDPAATGAAKAQHGPTTYVFKGGVIYRGELRPQEDGLPGDPIRLTSDPHWGAGPAVIAGSEAVTGWKQGADRPDIPDAGKVWWTDLDFAPRCLWMTRNGHATRIDLACTPHWSVTDPEDVKSQWWRFQQPNWWTGACKINFQGHRAHIGIDTVHLTHDASYYVGATAHVEYGIVMGTPFPTRVEGFDAQRKGIIFQGIWLGDSESILTNCRYFLEDKPQYLDGPGEFWFDKKGAGGRLYLRLPKDADPASSTVEAAKRINLIESGGLEHVVISGLSFRWTNVPWDLTQPPWANPDIDNAAIRIRGRAVDLRIVNCRFADVAKAIRIDAKQGNTEDPIDGIVIADNDIERTDHGAINVSCHSEGDVKILRNHLRLIGLRTFRMDHSHALCVEFPRTMEIAGNILERTTAAGIFAFGGKASGDGRDVPLARYLIHDNKAYQTLLSADDWGGIETWQGGPFYNYNNISGDPNGLWWSYDAKKAGSARLGFAYYHDGGSKNYDFNEVAYGNSTDWTSKEACNAAFYEATPTIQNQIFNCTVSRFWTGSEWSPAGGRHFFLGDIFDHIGDKVFDHGQLKEDAGKTVASYPHDTVAYGRNVFHDIPAKGFASYGATFDTPAAMAASFADRPALIDDVGTVAPASLFMDGAKNDFRPKPGSAAAGRGVTVFVPWALARTVGEWQFRLDRADPTLLLDDHWYMTPYYVNRDDYHDCPVNNLVMAGATAKDYLPGRMENWTDSALSFDGKRSAVLSQKTMSAPYSYHGPGNKPMVAQGADLATPDVGTTSMVIEAYLQTRKPGTILVSKRAASGYELAINRTGGVTFTVIADGAGSAVASGARITDGAWHHVLAEFDRAANVLNIYTDGVKTASSPCGLPAGASLSNQADFLVGKGPVATGAGFVGAIDFLRVARSSLSESETSIEELYDWEFDGPFLRDFAGHAPGAKGRDAGAFQSQGR